MADTGVNYRNANAQTADKAQWIERDRLRWCRRFSIPISEKTPEPFPQLTLGAQRALCAVSLLHPEKLTACFEALYQAFWVEGQTISKAEVFGPVLLSVLGNDKGKEVLAAAGGVEAKKLLADNTDLAVREGAFGLPWFVATNSKGEKEGFWGFDHLGQVVEHLGLERTGEGFKAML